MYKFKTTIEVVVPNESALETLYEALGDVETKVTQLGGRYEEHDGSLENAE